MANKTVVTFLAREQKFRISLSGLQPLTQHYVYFERVLLAANKTKPDGGKLGAKLITSASGKLDFDFYYAANLPTAASELTSAQKSAQLVAGVKEIVLSNELFASKKLPATYLSTGLSTWTGQIVVQIDI